MYRVLIRYVEMLVCTTLANISDVPKLADGCRCQHSCHFYTDPGIVNRVEHTDPTKQHFIVLVHCELAFEYVNG